MYFLGPKKKKKKKIPPTVYLNNKSDFQHTYVGKIKANNIYKYMCLKCIQHGYLCEFSNIN